MQIAEAMQQQVDNSTTRHGNHDNNLADFREGFVILRVSYPKRSLEMLLNMISKSRIYLLRVTVETYRSEGAEHKQ